MRTRTRRIRFGELVRLTSAIAAVRYSELLAAAEQLDAESHSIRSTN